MSDAVQCLRRIAARAAAGESLDSADGVWLAQSIGKYLEGAYLGVTLDSAFEIEPAWWVGERHHRKGKMIYDFSRCYCGHGDFSERLRVLTNEFGRYDRRLWPIDRERGLSPAFVGTPRESLFDIFKFCGGEVPTSAKQLGRILLSHCERNGSDGHVTPLPMSKTRCDSPDRNGDDNAIRQHSKASERRRAGGRRQGSAG
jgi:hypothetical protein